LSPEEAEKQPWSNENVGAKSNHERETDSYGKKKNSGDVQQKQKKKI
jgi:hypothetical protein